MQRAHVLRLPCSAFLSGHPPWAWAKAQGSALWEWQSFGSSPCALIRMKRPAPWLDPWRGWYQLERWRRIRRHQLRGEPLCAFCLQRGVATAATIADHVESHGGNWNLFLTGKLQSLCSHCHESAKRYDDSKARLDADGWPIA